MFLLLYDQSFQKPRGLKFILGDIIKSFLMPLGYGGEKLLTEFPFFGVKFAFDKMFTSSLINYRSSNNNTVCLALYKAWAHIKLNYRRSIGGWWIGLVVD